MDRRRLAIGLLAAGILLIAVAYVFLPAKGQSNGEITLTFYDVDNPSDSFSWPFIQKEVVCYDRQNPDDIYSLYNWWDSVRLFPTILPDGTTKYSWDYSAFGWATVGDTWYIAYGYDRDVLGSWISCSDWDAQYVYFSGDTQSVIDGVTPDYGKVVYPAYNGNGQWFLIYNVYRLYFGSVRGSCTDYAWMNYIDDSGSILDSFITYYLKSGSRIYFDGYIPGQTAAVFVDAPVSYSCYSPSDSLASYKIGEFLITDDQQYRVDLTGIEHITRGPCFIAMAQAGGKYYFITGWEVTDTSSSPHTVRPVLGPAVPGYSGYWYPYNGELVCAIAGTHTAYDPWNKQIVTFDFKFPSISSSGTVPVVTMGDKKYLVSPTTYFNYFCEYDYCTFDTGTDQQVRYISKPLVLNGIRWIDPPAVPRGDDHAVIRFTLDYNAFPLVDVNALDILNVYISVDGQLLDANSPFEELNYDFQYGSHTICYSFTMNYHDLYLNYNECYPVKVSYAPWDVSFTYEYNGPNVTFLASASDDGTIVKYIWDIDGPDDFTLHEESDSPVLYTPLPHPGDYNVTLTVVDDTGVATSVTGTITLTAEYIPSGVVYKDVYRTSVAPTVTTSSSTSPISSALSAIPVSTEATAGLGILLAILGVVVILWK